jgi:hypothetical protein
MSGGCAIDSLTIDSLTVLTILFQLLEGASEMNFATHLQKAIVGLRRSQQLQRCSDGLGNACSAGVLRLCQQVIWAPSAQWISVSK